LSRTKWFLGKLADIAVDIIAGILLYLILGEYIYQPLSEISPYLPTLLAVALVFTIICGFLFRLFKSVKFHRFVERTLFNLVEFLQKWNELNEAFDEAITSRNQEAIARFESHRAWLLYTYPKVSSATKITRYSYIDRIQGITVHNYDIIGNLIAKCPFIGIQWFNVDFASRDFKRQWDMGRTVLISTIGYFDCYRNSLMHKIYRIFHLVPILDMQKTNSIESENHSSDG